MPGMGELIDGAMQQAAQRGRQVKEESALDDAIPALSRAQVQWLIIQGRLLGKLLAPLAAVTVALRLPGEQQPQPAGWRRRW